LNSTTLQLRAREPCLPEMEEKESEDTGSASNLEHAARFRKRALQQRKKKQVPHWGKKPKRAD